MKKISFIRCIKIDQTNPGVKVMIVATSVYIISQIVMTITLLDYHKQCLLRCLQQLSMYLTPWENNVQCTGNFIHVVLFIIPFTIESETHIWFLRTTFMVTSGYHLL